MNLKFFAADGVVSPGGAMLDLIPLQDTLVFEAKVQPLDIDVVHPDLPATARLVALSKGPRRPLQGTVTKVSADVVVDEKASTTYYLATIEVERRNWCEYRT
jgi:polyisoprenoid-binding protein YceI